MCTTNLLPSSFAMLSSHAFSSVPSPFTFFVFSPSCPQVHQEGKAYPPNTLFLHTVDGLYCGENVRKVGHCLTSFYSLHSSPLPPYLPSLSVQLLPIKLPMCVPFSVVGWWGRRGRCVKHSCGQTSGSYCHCRRSASECVLVSVC